jgi:large subunit ribosomal protein L10
LKIPKLNFGKKLHKNAFLIELALYEPKTVGIYKSYRGDSLFVFIMAITKDKKRDIVAKLTDAFKEASSVAFVSFSKLTVKDASRVRKELAETGVRYYVAKKTLIRLALKKHGYEGEVPDLPGEVAVAWTAGESDTTAPARRVHDLGKKLKGAVALVGGVFEGVFADVAKMTEIALIPSLGALRGMFANIINSPRARFAIALGEVSKKKASA